MIFLTDLLPHQEDAVRKLRKLPIGALFMDMGTGKTRTALELIKERLEKSYVEKVLWLCPCSVIDNLKQDLIRHCGEVPKEIKIAGIESISASGRIYLELLSYVGQDKKCYLIVDESSLIKNPLAIRSKRIENLAESCTFKLILNGTPISRNEADLYQQFKLLDWTILGYRSYYTFAANHLEFKEVRQGSRKIKTKQIVRCLNTGYLASKIEPYTYQIKKDECFKLPEKKYHFVPCHMTQEQSKAYRQAKDEFLMQVDELRSETIYRFFTALQHVTSGRTVKDHEGKMIVKNLFEDWRDNPRIVCLQRLVQEIDGKCIIFAKYKQEIEEIEAMLTESGKSWIEFTGQISIKDRDRALEKFKDDTQFLIANKTCGAFGLNLQHCHNIIFYSNDFNYATRLQSEDRVHRLGQKEVCHIYDIVMKDTIDEFIDDNLGKKGGLLKAFKKEIEEMKKKKKGKMKNEQKIHRQDSVSSSP